MSNLELYEAFRAVPETAQKTIKGGRLNGMTDINPMWRIKTLTERFGPCGIGWKYTIDKHSAISPFISCGMANGAKAYRPRAAASL